MAEPTKRCCHCKKVESITFFHKDKSTLDGLSRRCIDCTIERGKTYYQKKYKESPDYFTDKHLKSRFGITLADYDRMSAVQNGTCAVCGGFETRPNVSRLSVDHNHKTGEIRALLCNRCNVLLGVADDNIELLYQTIQYLKGYSIE